MKTITPKIIKSIVVTLILISISVLILLSIGNLNMVTFKLSAGLNSMYAFPIILGNLLLMPNSDRLNKASLFKQILKSISLSMIILFAMNFVLWVIVWGAPVADLFTERNLVFYSIGFCILIVVSIIYNLFLHRFQSKRPI